MKRILKTNKFLLLLFAGITMLLLSGCYKEESCIRGNGRPEIETRITSTFNEVVNNGSFEVHILPGDRHEVQVDAESNLLPYIRTSVSGRRLFIETVTNRCINSTMSIIVTVYTPYVDGIELNGSGYVSAYDLYLDELSIRLNGSGEIIADADALNINATITGSGIIELSGITETTNLNISGSGQIKAFSLNQRRCYANISGSGNMYVRVSDLLDAVISGSGNIYYRGNPNVIQRISGSGRVIRQ
jgi:hypothetical protein